MLDNCFRFAPRDSIPGLIAKICKYLKDHPGWSEAELEEQIKKFISATGVESFNGRTGTVTLNKNDVNNLKIASAYFAEGNESIDRLDLVSLYNQGVRFVFTDFNSATSGYNLAFVLDYFSGSGDVVYYQMSTGSGGGNIVSVNGKTGVVELSLADIVGTSGVQVKICTEAEFTSSTTATWNTYYNEGYRIIGVVNSSATAIDYIYLLKQDENNHTPIALSTGASDAYTPSNPPPYPVKSVNGKTGVVTGLYDAENQPPYPVTSVNGKTGVVTGLYDAENQPPYPVTSVNGDTGSVMVTRLINANNRNISMANFLVDTSLGFQVGTGSGHSFNFSKNYNDDRFSYWAEDTNSVGYFYSTHNPPPYPVTAVLGRTGSVYHGEEGLTIDESNTNKNMTFGPFKTIIARTDAGTLPNGNSITLYWIFNEQVSPSLGSFIVTTLNPYLRSCLIGVGTDSKGRGYIAITSLAIGAEVTLTNYHTMVFNVGNVSYTLYDVLRYLP